MLFDPWALVGIGASFAIAGTIKGTVGIGLPAAVIGMMSLIIAPKLAITVAVVPVVALNIWQYWSAGDRLGALRRYGLFIAIMVPVLFATTFVTAQVDGRILSFVLGVAVIIFAGTNLLGTLPALNPSWDRTAQIVGGLTSGVFGGLTSVWGPAAMIYLLAKRVDKAEFVRGCGVIFACGGVPLFVGFMWNGLLVGQVAWISVAMVVPALVGFAIGARLRSRVNEDRFRTLVLIVFLIVGLNLLRRALMG